MKDRRTRQQLLNDIATVERRWILLQEANDKLTQRATLAERDLQAALVEAADWRSAFKLIMKLVK